MAPLGFLFLAGTAGLALTNPAPKVLSPLVVADAALLRRADISVLGENGGIAWARADEAAQLRLQTAAHAQGRCGGYELWPETSSTSRAEADGGRIAKVRVTTSNKEVGKASAPTMASSVEEQIAELAVRKKRDERAWAPNMKSRKGALSAVSKDAQIASAVGQVDPAHLKETVDWLSSFPTRYHNNAEANVVPEALRAKIQTMIGSVAGATSQATQVELVTHTRTPQKSVRVRIEGDQRSAETVVLGAHLDSINWGGGKKSAPGADDDASGVANLVEVLRVLLSQPQPHRSVELYFYAAEEAGLLGSSEIAQRYKDEKRDVVAVMQLDMTLHPGEGELILASMTDFTDPWLRARLATLNDLYVHAKMHDDECGYGCSDHAPWYRHGFPTVMPFETSFATMNPAIHTADDVVNARSNFVHSAVFSKLALAMVLDLGRSADRRP